jgi:hypothetical protein
MLVSELWEQSRQLVANLAGYRRALSATNSVRGGPNLEVFLGKIFVIYLGDQLDGIDCNMVRVPVVPS